MFGFFKRLFGLKSAENLPAGDDRVFVQRLAEKLKDWGYRAQVEADAIRLPELNLLIEPSIAEKQQNKDLLILTLNFGLTIIPTGDFLPETLAGHGQNLEEALDDGLRSFQPLLELLVQAVNVGHNPDLDFQTGWGERTLSWHPYISNLTLRTSMDQPPADGSLPEYFEMLKPEIIPALGNCLFYLIKVYLGRVGPDGEPVSECLINGERLGTSAETILKEVIKDWPPEDFRSEKQYFILRQCGSTFQTLKSFQELDLKIGQALALMVEKYQDENLYGYVIYLMGGDEDLARELFFLLPHLCCTSLFSTFNYGNRLILQRPDGRQESLALSQLPVYGRAKKAVRRYLEQHYDEDRLTKFLLVHSACLKAINQAAHQGLDLDSLRFESAIEVPESYNPYR